MTRIISECHIRKCELCGERTPGLLVREKEENIPVCMDHLQEQIERFLRDRKYGPQV